MRIKLFPLVQLRLDEIWEYTSRVWGDEQAYAYIDGLTLACENIPLVKSRWRRLRTGGIVGVSFIRFRHHYIYFRQLDEEMIGVISILHKNMHMTARLREDIDGLG